MGEPCDTCGGFGNANLIFTCSRCKIGREHCYCMRKILYEAPPDEEDNNWLCETCLRNDTISLKADLKADTTDISILKSHDGTQIIDAKFSRSGLDGSGQQSANREQPKVKYISFEEASRLSSGAIVKKPSIQFNMTPKLGSSNSRQSIFGRVPTSPLIAPPDVPSLMMKRTTSFFPSWYTEPRRSSTLQLNSMTNKRASNSSKGSEGGINRTSGIDWKYADGLKRMDRSPSIDVKHVDGIKGIDKSPGTKGKQVEDLKRMADSPGIDGKQVDRRKGMDMPPVFESKALKSARKWTCSPAKAFRTSNVTAKNGGTTQAVAERNNNVAGERDLLNVLAKVKQFLPHLPSLEVIWKGAFRTRSGESYFVFNAHLSSRVHRKAYEFSKKMPEVLKIKFLPRRDLWAEVFQDCSPDLCDIALYFLPSDLESSKENNALLLLLMEKRDLVMKSYIDGVELFVITSKHLLWDSPNGTVASTNDHFLWGVLRPAKSYASTELSEYASDDANMDGGQSIDMEIDMIGGQNVRRGDLAVSKESCRRNYVRCKRDETTLQTLELKIAIPSNNKKCSGVESSRRHYGSCKREESTQQTAGVKTITPSSNMKWYVAPVSVKSEKQDRDGIPPGYEQMPKG